MFKIYQYEIIKDVKVCLKMKEGQNHKLNVEYFE